MSDVCVIMNVNAVCATLGHNTNRRHRGRGLAPLPHSMDSDPQNHRGLGRGPGRHWGFCLLCGCELNDRVGVKAQPTFVHTVNLDPHNVFIQIVDGHAHEIQQQTRIHEEVRVEIFNRILRLFLNLILEVGLHNLC
jgi:hypothetical protein